MSRCFQNFLVRTHPRMRHTRDQLLAWLERLRQPAEDGATVFRSDTFDPSDIVADVDVDPLSRYTFYVRTPLSFEEARNDVQSAPLNEVHLHPSLPMVPVNPDFWMHMQDCLRCLEERFRTRPPNTFTAVAHSVGAGAALLLAMHLRERFRGIPIEVVTFGGCRVGGLLLLEILQRQGVSVTRYVVPEDPMPGLPSLPYTHAGELYYLHADGFVTQQLAADEHRHIGTVPGAHSLEEYIDRLHRGLYPRRAMLA